MKFLKPIKDALFPQYIQIPHEDIRVNSATGVAQGYSSELGKWMDLDYLQGTNYDAGQWLYNYKPHVEMEIRRIQKEIVNV